MNVNFLAEGFRRILFISPELPRRYQVEITNRCNFNCPMCQRRFWDLPQEDMPLDCFIQLLDRIPKQKNPPLIILCGYGEPFLNQDFLKMVKLCREKGYRTQSTTNGALLNRFDIDSLINDGPDRLGISIDSLKESDVGHSCSIDLEFVARFARRAFKVGSPHVSIQTVFHKDFWLYPKFPK